MVDVAAWLRDLGLERYAPVEPRPSGAASTGVRRPRRSVSGVRNVTAASLLTWDALDGTGPWVSG